MNERQTLTVHPGGEGEYTVCVNELKVPDLWHIAQSLKEAGDYVAAELVLKTWHLTHAMKDHIQALPDDLAIVSAHQRMMDEHRADSARFNRRHNRMRITAEDALAAWKVNTMTGRNGSYGPGEADYEGGEADHYFKIMQEDHGFAAESFEGLGFPASEDELKESQAWIDLIDLATSQGHCISAWDGEQWFLKSCYDFREAMDAIKYQPECQIDIWTKDGERLGWALIVLDDDLAEDDRALMPVETVADYTGTDWMNAWAKQYLARIKAEEASA